MARVLACGAFLKNTSCLLDTDHPQTVTWSEVHGDLSDPAACVALERSVRTMLAQAGGRIDALAHDLHPDFFSTHLAQRLAAELGVTAIAVQHHHAHIAAVLAEQGLERPVLGIALDGVGLGSDGTAWGGEVLRVDGAHFERVGHLLPLALPGGDVAAREPWRMAAAALHACGLAEQIVPRFTPTVGEQAARTIDTMLQRGVNCPPTSAAGRWFDAAAGLLGLSVRQAFEAQAAIALEQAAVRYLQDHLLQVRSSDWVVTPDGQLDLRPLLVSSVMGVDGANPLAVDEAAARFHLTLADALSAHTVAQAHLHQLRDVALGGGCFFNQILRQRIAAQLSNAGLNVWQTQKLSCGDAGLALGQAWVAARMLTTASQRPDFDRKTRGMSRVHKIMSLWPTWNVRKQQPLTQQSKKALMCLAIPARVVELLPNLRAIVDLGGVRKEVSIDLVDDAQVDDYVIIHVGYALGKIDPEEAQRTLDLFAELSASEARV